MPFVPPSASLRPPTSAAERARIAAALCERVATRQAALKASNAAAAAHWRADLSALSSSSSVSSSYSSSSPPLATVVGAKTARAASSSIGGKRAVRNATHKAAAYVLAARIARIVSGDTARVVSVADEEEGDVFVAPQKQEYAITADSTAAVAPAAEPDAAPVPTPAPASVPTRTPAPTAVRASKVSEVRANVPVVETVPTTAKSMADGSAMVKKARDEGKRLTANSAATHYFATPSHTMEDSESQASATLGSDSGSTIPAKTDTTSMSLQGIRESVPTESETKTSAATALVSASSTEKVEDVAIQSTAAGTQRTEEVEAAEVVIASEASTTVVTGRSRAQREMGGGGVARPCLVDGLVRLWEEVSAVWGQRGVVGGKASGEEGVAVN